MTHKEQSIVRLADPDSHAFAQFFAIYEEALPVAERKTRDAIAALMHRDDYRVEVLLEQQQVIAFLILFLSATRPVALLEYMATRNGVRNQGIGSRLFLRAAELAGERPMLIEVDSERENAPDRALRVRRKQFYIRHGCRPLHGVDYLMPAVGDATTPTMDLLLHWPGHHETPSHDQLRQWLQCVYTEVYGQPSDDPRIETMVRGVTGDPSGLKS